MRLKKYFLGSFALILMTPAVSWAASFDSMFGGAPVTSLDQWIQLTWSWMATLVIMASTMMLMAAGYIYMVSGGDPQRVAKAKQMIVGVFSGLFILVVSYFFFTQILGIDNIWKF